MRNGITFISREVTAFPVIYSREVLAKSLLISVNFEASSQEIVIKP